MTTEELKKILEDAPIDCSNEIKEIDFWIDIINFLPDVEPLKIIDTFGIISNNSEWEFVGLTRNWEFKFDGNGYYSMILKDWNEVYEYAGSLV